MSSSIQALPPALRPTDDDWAKMLSAHVHLGTKNLDNNMVRSSPSIFIFCERAYQHGRNTCFLADSLHLEEAC
jgi:hypothetical protein